MFRRLLAVGAIFCVFANPAYAQQVDDTASNSDGTYRQTIPTEALNPACPNANGTGIPGPGVVGKTYGGTVCPGAASNAPTPLASNAAQETGGNLAASKSDLDIISGWSAPLTNAQLTTQGLAKESGGNLATIANAQGVSGAGISQPTGGSGVLGFLSGIYHALTGTLSVTVGNFPASQAVIGTFYPYTLNGDGGVPSHVTNFPTTQPVSGSVTTASGSVTTNTPVDQVAPTGSPYTITTTGNTTISVPAGAAKLTDQFSGTFSGLQVRYYGSNDGGTTLSGLQSRQSDTTAAIAAYGTLPVSSGGVLEVSTAGFTTVVRTVTAITSGSATARSLFTKDPTNNTVAVGNTVSVVGNVGGLETAASPVTGGGIRMMGSDGTNARDIRTDTSGNVYTNPANSAPTVVSGSFPGGSSSVDSPINIAGYSTVTGGLGSGTRSNVNVSTGGALSVALGPNSGQTINVQGGVASGVTDSGSPVKTGGVAGVLGTPVTAGQRVDDHSTLYGAKYVSLQDSGGTVSSAIVGQNDGQNNYGLVVNSYCYTNNGSTNDRCRSAGAITNASTTGVQAVGDIGFVGYADSTTALGVSTTFNGSARTPPNYMRTFKCKAYADQAGTLNLQESDDSGSTYQTVSTAAITAAGVSAVVKEDLTGVPGTTLMRCAVVNGPTAEATLRLTSAFGNQ